MIHGFIVDPFYAVVFGKGCKECKLFYGFQKESDLILMIVNINKSSHLKYQQLSRGDF